MGKSNICSEADISSCWDVVSDGESIHSSSASWLGVPRPFADFVPLAKSDNSLSAAATMTYRDVAMTDIVTLSNSAKKAQDFVDFNNSSKPINKSIRIGKAQASSRTKCTTIPSAKCTTAGKNIKTDEDYAADNIDGLWMRDIIKKTAGGKSKY